jgi:hypothetical protein
VTKRLGSLLEAWHDAFGKTDQTVSAALQVAETNPALHNALEAIGEDRGKLNARKIGNFLSRHEGRSSADIGQIRPEHDKAPSSGP